MGLGVNMKVFKPNSKHAHPTSITPSTLLLKIPG
jgi:hypothetical protein